MAKKCGAGGLASRSEAHECVLDTARHGTHNTEKPVALVSTNPKWEISG